MTEHDLSNPILNSPFEPPQAHFEFGEAEPTGKVLPGRRPSESSIPVPVSRKKAEVDEEARAEVDEEARAEVDEEARAELYGTVSRPFPSRPPAASP